MMNTYDFFWFRVSKRETKKLGLLGYKVAEDISKFRKLTNQLP